MRLYELKKTKTRSNTVLSCLIGRVVELFEVLVVELTDERGGRREEASSLSHVSPFSALGGGSEL